MVNQYEKQTTDTIDRLDNNSFTGTIVSIAEAASITGSPYWKLELPYKRYQLFDDDYLNEDYIELAEFSNVISNHIFQVFFPEKNIAIVDEASYVNALSSFPMPHKREGNSINFEWKKPIVDIDEPVLMLGGQNNHYHWILNWLPRLFVAKTFPDAFGDLGNLKVCVHEGISETYIQTLEMLGVKRSNLIFNSMFYGNSKHFFRFKKLYLPTFFKNTQFSTFVRDSYLKFFTENSILKQDRNSPKLIYVSRQKEQRRKRRVVNNQEVEKCVKRFGFETIYAEDLSFEEQANLFYNADFVLGPHGAGIANIVFCRPKTKLLVFEYKKRTEFKGLANICQMKPIILPTEQYIDEAYEREHPEFPSRFRDFIVDTNRLESCLKDALSIVD